MAYIKNTWADQDVERPKTYEVTNNQDGSITLTDSFGMVTELGTPINAVNMNHIEDGIDGCAIRKHNLTETFNLGEWVLGGTGDDEGIYKSLIANNIGNALTDNDAWEKVKMGGSSRNVGEIISSTLPLTDAGLHLLDGSLLQYGIYKEFIDYIADLYAENPNANYFTTESAWQASVTTYGSCGKFVYDSTNNTVRLPKVTGKIDGTTDINALGDLEPLFVRLPNITGTFAMGKAGQSSNGYTSTGAFYDGGDTLTGNSAQSGGATRLFGFNASRSSSVYSGNGSNTAIHEQAIKMFVYIVIANSTKTDIQVDIDQVATDLNGKADTDLTNTTNQGYIKMAGAGMPSGTYINLTLGASGSQYTAPANGWYYLNKLYGGNNLFTKLINITRGYAVNNTFHSTSTFNCDLLLPIKKGDVISVDYNTTGAVQVFRFYYAVGSESEAS